MQTAHTASAVRTLRASLLEALAEDFRDHGRAAIAKFRGDKPGDYLKLVSAHTPDDSGKPDDPFAPYSDAELIAVLERLRPRRPGEREDGA